MILVLLYDFILCIAHKAPPRSCSRHLFKKKLHFFTSVIFLKNLFFFKKKFKPEYHQSKNLDPDQA